MLFWIIVILLMLFVLWCMLKVSSMADEKMLEHTHSLEKKKEL